MSTIHLDAIESGFSKELEKPSGKCRWCNDTKKITMFTSVVECGECSNKGKYIPNDQLKKYFIYYSSSPQVGNYFFANSKHIRPEFKALFTDDDLELITDICDFLNHKPKNQTSTPNGYIYIGTFVDSKSCWDINIGPNKGDDTYIIAIVPSGNQQTYTLGKLKEVYQSGQKTGLIIYSAYLILRNMGKI